jgi:hypothetical protein
MIEVRACAEFRADFPDDGLENEFGFLLFPGKGVPAAIAEMLRGIGCEVSDPIHADEHGWELRIEFKKARMWCQVTSLDAQDCILLFADGAFMGNSSNSAAYLEAIAKLNLQMRRDPRFHDIGWQRWREPQGPAASNPLDVDLDRLPKPAPRPNWFGWGAKEAGAAEQRAARIRNKAKIGAHFPDDTVREGAKIVQWRGKGVTAAIAEILRRLGAEVSGPINAEPRWDLEIRCEGQNTRRQIEHAEGLVYLDLDDRLAVDHPAYVELIVQLDAELHRDCRFHDIR